MMFPIHRRYDVDGRTRASILQRNRTIILRGEMFHVGAFKVGRIISGSLRFLPFFRILRSPDSRFRVIDRFVLIIQMARRGE